MKEEKIYQAVYLRNQNYSYESIAKAVETHHTTILYWFGKLQRKPSKNIQLIINKTKQMNKQEFKENEIRLRYKMFKRILLEQAIWREPVQYGNEMRRKFKKLTGVCPCLELDR